MTSDASKQVIFIQNAIPPLRDGSYVLTATQKIPGQDPGSFSANSTFVVQGERFTIQGTEIDSVFPPNLANGEFDGVLPHVVFNRRTLPWERTLDTPGSAQHYPDAPWLAILVLDDATAPQLAPATAKALVEQGAPITVDGKLAGVGTLVRTTLSYGSALLGALEYGQTADDPCQVIDLPLATFVQVAPAAADLVYLAHIREVDTTDGVDSDTTTEQHAVVVANRIPPSNGVARALLVSLEGLADYLPAADGTQSPAIAALDRSIDTVRLIAYQSWTFTTNDMDQTLARLLEGLNTPPLGGPRVTTLTLPIQGTAPGPERIAQAMANQARGRLDDGDADVLVQNALLMGYVPLGHHLRHGGHTVSFYRGPLVPFAVPATAPAYFAGPDAATAYDAKTGMFDLSYSAAWQLGQLLALHSVGMANQLYQWKRAMTMQQAIAVEEALLARRLGGAPLFASVLGRRRAVMDAGPPPLPDDVVTWFGNLAALAGVPFNYLVPDERMLPPESIRLFYLDPNWIDALIDGAFSIGRAAVSPQSIEVRHAPMLRRRARMASIRAANRVAARSALARASGARVEAIADLPGATSATVTGFLIRSAAVQGWPNLRIVGFSDLAATQEIAPSRVVRLSNDTTLCLFAGEVAAMYLREPPEQLHHGVEGTAGKYYTTLRSVNGGPGSIPAGKQYTDADIRTPRVTPCDVDGTHPRTCIPMRGDGRTVNVSTAATAIQSRLTSDFGQTLPRGFTSAELALELTKGVVEVEYRR